jgi:hypothetical protein
MSFYGKSFIYDNTASETYGLYILDFDETGGLNESEAGSTTEPIEEWIYRRSKSYHYGNIMNTPLEFDLSVASYTPITGDDRGKIAKWLLGRGNFKKLQICEDDISNVYFNTICTSAKTIYVGNVQRGLKLHFRCDSPWAWEFPKTLTYNFTGNEIKNFIFDFYNSSDSDEYLYPIVDFTLNSIGNGISIENITTGDTAFTFTGISPNENIVVDNSLKTIVSDTGLLRLNYFNKQWLKFISGRNELHVISGIGTLKLVTQFARKIGA